VLVGAVPREGKDLALFLSQQNTVAIKLEAATVTVLQINESF
jgi:hypothetical protein